MTNAWKGLILAGGTGSRLHPLTYAVNKHLLPVYDKPMIYYPLSTLMLAGLRDFVIVSTPQALPQLQALLGDGSQWGVRFSYVAQNRPGGIAEGFRVAANELEGHKIALILGDNIFYGDGLPKRVQEAVKLEHGATVFAYEVSDPHGFGVIEIDQEGRPISLEEKPRKPKSNLIVPGLYFYEKDVLDLAWDLKPSVRGELEITDINRIYLDRGELNVVQMGRGIVWLDCGTHSDLFEASQYIQVIEKRTGLKLACPEEIAFRMKFIDRKRFARTIDQFSKTEYGEYLHQLIKII